MLARLTSKNQITIPKGIMARLPDVQYFDVDYVDGKILLKPLKVHGTDLGEVRAKIKSLGLSEDCVDEAIRWARSR
ncbi:MAG: AbrB/MazE/SpoVT family DNA-binding domain-containing protein [Deltaproteobacteria bacterium]|nr:AbrB/MazE/SpoVT family DNA-binding domain-containing protein [Deltaproteobacteria bacterium]